MCLVSPCGLVSATYIPCFTLNGGEYFWFTDFRIFTACRAEWSTASTGST